MRPLNHFVERLFATRRANAMSHAIRDPMMNGTPDLISPDLPDNLKAPISEWLIAIDNQIIRLTGGFVD